MPNATVRANARSMPKSSDQPDAAIFALAKELAAAAKAYDETMHAIEEAEERCRSITSPPVIMRTERDKQLGLFVGNRVGVAYTDDDVPALRALVRAHTIVSGPRDWETWSRAREILGALRDLKDHGICEKISGLTESEAPRSKGG